MTKLSLCMIVKNEELTLNRCLKSIKDAVDEIIIVDTGSTDKTKLIASRYTTKIFDFQWCNDFSKARNYAFGKANGDYIMWLDADDVVPFKTMQFIANNKKNFTADTYMLKYEMGFIKRTPQFSYYRERILRNCPMAQWQGAVHECITPFGKIETLNYAIYHKKISPPSPDRNIKIYESIIKTRPLIPREQYYYGRELFDHGHYKKCIKIMKNFISSKQGWEENIIDAYIVMSKCYLRLNNPNKQIECLLKALEYTPPRANICCFIGDYFLSHNKYNMAISWYLLATSLTIEQTAYGFTEKTYTNYYPHLQLCVCYFHMHDYKKSFYHNSLAKKFFTNETTTNNEKLLLQYINK